MATTKYPEHEFMIPSDQLLAHAILGTAKNFAVLPDLAHWAPGALVRTGHPRHQRTAAVP